MSPTRKPSRIQVDLREEIWVAPGRTVLPWTTRNRRPDPEPAPASPLTAECTCPVDCIRDHETD